MRLLLSREFQDAGPCDCADHTRGPVLGCPPPDVHHATQTLPAPATCTGCDCRRRDRRADRRPDRGRRAECRGRDRGRRVAICGRGRARRSVGPEQRRRDADQGRPRLEEDRQPAGAGRRVAAVHRAGRGIGVDHRRPRQPRGPPRPEHRPDPEDDHRRARADRHRGRRGCRVGGGRRGGHRDPDRPRHEPQGRQADQGRAGPAGASPRAAGRCGSRTSAATRFRASTRAPTASSRRSVSATGRRT